MRKQILHSLMRKPLGILAVLILLSSASFRLEQAVAAEGLALSGQPASIATDGTKVWLVVKAKERRLELVGDYSYRMDGAGPVNFKEDGRVIELPEGLSVLVEDKKVETERRVHEGESVRVVNSKGETVWKLSPVRSEEMSW